MRSFVRVLLGIMPVLLWASCQQTVVLAGNDALLPQAVIAQRPAGFADFDQRARAGEHLSVVFFGASLTWGANASDPERTSYRADVARRLCERYPEAHFQFWDAAIGGTGSQLGVFRFDRDVLRRKPDLVFLDFTANDGIHYTDPSTLASYESLVRRIILDAHAPVVQVIFPFEEDVARGDPAKMYRRLAHIRISQAYHTGCGDAVVLCKQRVTGTDGGIDPAKLHELWSIDAIHPGDRGYAAFADAAWAGLMQAIEEKRVCQAPPRMLNADTYMHQARVRISSLGPLPEGWRIGQAHRVSAFFDMLMSRWLDDEVIASNAPADDKAGAPVGPTPQPLRVKFSGSMVMLFGESTPESGHYRVTIDGRVIERRGGTDKPDQFDAGQLAHNCKGNVHLTQVIETGLDANVEHTLELQPVFTGDKPQELRLESICVAGGDATVQRDH